MIEFTLVKNLPGLVLTKDTQLSIKKSSNLNEALPTMFLEKVLTNNSTREYLFFLKTEKNSKDFKVFKLSQIELKNVNVVKTK